MSSEHDPADSERPASTGSDEPLVQPVTPSGRGVAGGGASAPADPPSGPPGSRNMLPQRQGRRSRVERLLVRLVATCGIVAIGVAIAAIMVSNNAQGWIVGLVVSVVSVVLAAILWSSRQL